MQPADLRSDAPADVKPMHQGALFFLPFFFPSECCLSSWLLPSCAAVPSAGGPGDAADNKHMHQGGLADPGPAAHALDGSGELLGLPSLPPVPDLGGDANMLVSGASDRVLCPLQ